MVEPIHRHPLTEEIPPHLRRYLSKQDYSLYTPIDHAGWRFIMKIGRAFYRTHAHRKYLDGLEETGISVEAIPRIEEMDAKLRRFNWRAVPVIGFIPPAAFLEFQSYGLLPIACDMRKIENLEYTPAPDIVHEAAGHAPIIADPAFAAYLRSYGEVSRRAIFSNENMNVYYAVRALSDTKERPDATPGEVAAAEVELNRRLAEVTYDSEVDWVTRLGWWTTEYGLVGEIGNPQIYGAGLLSSIGEGYHCLSDKVRKLPLTIDCIHQPFNITEPQPQLFVTPNFEYLTIVLEELADRMAFRQGGVDGLRAAERGGTVCTAELDSGLQISGVVAGFVVGPHGRAEFLRFSGPVQLAFGDAQIEGHDPSRHSHGYSTPIGQIRSLKKSAADLTPADLETLGFRSGSRGRIEFETGIVLEGILEDRVDRNGRTVILTFRDCIVRDGDTMLYRPDWGPFDLACGGLVTSVFGGAADRYAYLVATESESYEPGIHKTNLTPANRSLNGLYLRLREIREEGRIGERRTELEQILSRLDADHPDDWLLRWEILELDREHRLGSSWSDAVRARLESMRDRGVPGAESIERGLVLLS